MEGGGMDGSHLSRAPAQVVRRSLGHVVGRLVRPPRTSVPELYAAALASQPAASSSPGLAGLADLQAALQVVAAGRASSITLCGFPDGLALLRMGQELAGVGIVVEPLTRAGQSGIDVRVRRARGSAR